MCYNYFGHRKQVIKTQENIAVYSLSLWYYMEQKKKNRFLHFETSTVTLPAV